MKKRSLAIILALLFFALGVSLIFVFEIWVEPNVNTTKVVVAAEDIKFKDEINADSLKVVSIKKEAAIKEAYTPNNLDDLINKHAAIEIKAGTQIYPEMIDSLNLIPDEGKGEFIAPIPDEWLFAVPGSLRKAYIADFYAIPDEDQQMLQNIINTAVSQEQEGLKEEEKDEPITTNSETDLLAKEVLKEEAILKDVRVASVKDRSNTEVENQDNVNGQYTTGVISNIEIIATEEILHTLKSYTQQGYKIYVVYKYGR